MSTLSPERWQAVSPYLDQALEMPEDERAAWLAAFREQNPSLAADLQRLLEEHQSLARKGFLEQDPGLPGGQAAQEGQTIVVEPASPEVATWR